MKDVKKDSGAFSKYAKKIHQKNRPSTQRGLLRGGQRM